MLYVSQVYARGSYGITDTDDGVETVVDDNGIQQLIDLKIQVHGVVVFDRDFEVYICKNPVEIKRLKAKVDLLYGVKIELSEHGAIAGASWDSSRVRPGTSIRLSDFAYRCKEVIFGYKFSNEQPLTLILDDNIDILPGTFHRFVSNNVRVDITEVRHYKIVEYVYECWLRDTMLVDAALVIKDSPERMLQWQAFGVVQNGIVPKNVSKFPDAVVGAVEARYMFDFEAVASVDFVIGSSIRTEEIKAYVKSLLAHRGFWESNPTSYSSIRKMDGLKVFRYMERCAQNNYQRVRRFYNYMKYFGTSLEIQQLYVKAVLRFNEVVFSAVRKQGERRRVRGS